MFDVNATVMPLHTPIPATLLAVVKHSLKSNCRTTKLLSLAV